MIESVCAAAMQVRVLLGPVEEDDEVSEGCAGATEPLVILCSPSGGTLLVGTKRRTNSLIWNQMTSLYS